MFAYLWWYTSERPECFFACSLLEDLYPTRVWQRSGRGAMALYLAFGLGPPL